MNQERLHKLPKSVQPISYTLLLFPNIENFIFHGEETIDIEVKEATKQIVLNSAFINISHVTFFLDDSVILCSNIEYDVDQEKVTLHYDQELPLGFAKLNIVFVGELNDKMKGFYRSKYVTTCGYEKYCAVTHFEPTGARHAFPCWDEPEIKATFRISIVASEKTVLSNMDLYEKKVYHNDSSLHVYSFNTTPVMSTYLVAFVVGNFDYIEGFVEDIPVRIYTPVGKSEQGSFALELTIKCMGFYNKYFGIKYHLPKIDLIALPNFPISAMENWGLVTYRENALLFDSLESSFYCKINVSLIVAHELSHNWFGNLVTMRWWTDLWLKEGFATWCQYLCIDHCYPNFNIWENFVSQTLVKALQLDSLTTSHPIEVYVDHPSQIDEIFDTISYCKGSTVIRMLHDYLGEDIFRNGLCTFLKTFQFQNAATNDLWHHLELASSIPVKQVMELWTKEMGYPVLVVTSNHVESQRTVTITQKKFSSNGSFDSKKLWSVPVALKTSKKHFIKVLMNEEEIILNIDNMLDCDWVKINPEIIGFYRVSYSQEMMIQLQSAINQFSTIDRLNFVNDLFALTTVGISSTSCFLEFLSSYKDEMNYAVWRDITSSISKICILLQNTNCYNNFQQFVAELYRPVAQKLGWTAAKNEDYSLSMLRCLVLKKLGEVGDPGVIKKSMEMFASHVNGIQNIPADLRVAVYSTVMSVADEHIFQQMITLYQNTEHVEERDRILRSIGNSTNPNLISKVLEFGLSDEVQSQSTKFVLRGCTTSLIGRCLTWNVAKKNWQEFQRRYSGIMLSSIVKICTNNFATESEYDNVKEFFQTYPTSSAERAISHSLESIKCNINWLARECKNINSWLVDYTSKQISN
ncbi:puromycin-sensitive aminopeptidase isoform X1 [Hydra vulgaris]|uniref:puromycin-sensitive aminopeptidase isoform X1 n=1 Tax=Hydra vulgaris TaxID=6087 RepID=UPI00064166E1|nr:puromycin-sensitive aminopeptidase [Hydra vulgaris]